MWSIQQTGHTEELYSNNLESGLLAQICWNNPKCGPGLSKLKFTTKIPVVYGRKLISEKEESEW